MNRSKRQFLTINFKLTYITSHFTNILCANAEKVGKADSGLYNVHMNFPHLYYSPILNTLIKQVVNTNNLRKIDDHIRRTIMVKLNRETVSLTWEVNELRKEKIRPFFHFSFIIPV